jgi:hypothetical protein
LLEILISSNKKELLQQMQQFERIVQRIHIAKAIEENKSHHSNPSPSSG